MVKQVESLSREYPITKAQLIDRGSVNGALTTVGPGNGASTATIPGTLPQPTTSGSGIPGATGSGSPNAGVIIGALLGALAGILSPFPAPLSALIPVFDLVDIPEKSHGKEERDKEARSVG